jgi:soluble lytic murein transglycosylase-like protein
VVAAVVIAAGLFAVRAHNNISHVESYRDMVHVALQEKEIKGADDLVLAIIYTETKGKVPDVMQSSESKHGEANVICSEIESIQQGVDNLSDVLSYAKAKDVDIWAGVQAYNYGKAYIDYIAKHGGKNTLELSEAYSRDVVAPSLGNTTGDQYNHYTLDAILYNRGKLYTNGGNIFYAQEVKDNMDLMRILGSF